MSQSSILTFFNERKIRATNVQNGKSKTRKVILDDDEDSKQNRLGKVNGTLVSKKFLEPISFPAIPRDKIMRWHPDFPVDKVPEIIPADLPQPPNANAPTTAKDMLERARNFLSSNPRLQETSEASTETKTETSLKPNRPPIFNDLLKGIPKALLEKATRGVAAAYVAPAEMEAVQARLEFEALEPHAAAPTPGAPPSETEGFQDQETREDSELFVDKER